VAASAAGRKLACRGPGVVRPAVLVDARAAVVPGHARSGVVAVSYLPSARFSSPRALPSPGTLPASHRTNPIGTWVDNNTDGAWPRPFGRCARLVPAIRSFLFPSCPSLAGHVTCSPPHEPYRELGGNQHRRVLDGYPANRTAMGSVAGGISPKLVLHRRPE